MLMRSSGARPPATSVAMEVRSASVKDLNEMECGGEEGYPLTPSHVSKLPTAEIFTNAQGINP